MPQKHLTPAERDAERQRKIAEEVAQHPPSRHDDGHAFVPDNTEGPARSSDELAEELAEDFLLGAEQNIDAAAERDDEVLPEEEGGPFYETSGHTEFAGSSDAGNPPDATREPLPNSGPTGAPGADKKPS